MKIQISNLGPIEQAEFVLNNLTVICGKNNTGKTYATYALFGFLMSWRENYFFKIKPKEIDALLKNGSIKIRIQDYIDKAPEALSYICQEFTTNLAAIFASTEANFSSSSFKITLQDGEVNPRTEFETIMGAAKTNLFSIFLEKGSEFVVVSLLVEKENMKIPAEVIKKIIADAIGEIVFGQIFSRPFIASTERTGAAIFRKELDFRKNRVIENVSSIGKEKDILQLMTSYQADYPLPVKVNIDFTRQLESLTKKTSWVAKQAPEILEDFSDIIGGKYLVTKNDELYFVPKGKRIRLTMDESSSAVRSLLDIGFYLRHIAAPGDILMIDEPELNLHPENQRRIARLLARLVNVGIKVFITTHSDYIVKEFNTLIMLAQKGSHFQEIAQREGYKEDELLDIKDINVYMAENVAIKGRDKGKQNYSQTLVPAEISSDLGIEARSFDETIDDMNRVQDEIIWGRA